MSDDEPNYAVPHLAAIVIYLFAVNMVISWNLTDGEVGIALFAGLIGAVAGSQLTALASH